MDPVAFSIFGIDVAWYGIIIGSAMLLGTILALKEAERVGFKEDDILDFLLMALPLSIVGARLYYVIFEWELYQGDILKMINPRTGGLAIHGGIIAAVIVGIIFTRKRKLDFWTMADILAPSLVLGQAIGRWGNYINQEAYGGPTDLPWGIIIDGVKVHPTFLYESIWNLAVFVFLLWYRKNKDYKSGEIFGLYLTLYSFIRFFIEGLRTDSLMLGSIRVAQLVSLIGFVIGLLVVVRRKKSRRKNNLKK